MAFEVQASTNLGHWLPVTTVTNLTGMLEFTDPNLTFDTGALWGEFVGIFWDHRANFLAKLKVYGSETLVLACSEDSPHRRARFFEIMLSAIEHVSTLHHSQERRKRTPLLQCR
jgi:hypothetical protein